ncbi:MAG: tRNA (guanosine(37)-N1)-methyltransferase TrmD [Candidatus Marinimicrobia bacterium]|nr:tRNA (guanosine(37)-N1)-methyltransferase TrmD [Candidatus Neomarinimicrobiota bacterium]
MISPVVNESIVKRAQEKGLVNIRVHDLREFSQDKHRKTDDYPFGGGSGMVMTPQPLYDGISTLLEGGEDREKPSRVVYPTADGRLFDQKTALSLSEEAHLLFVCGHYKGIDQRIRDMLITDEISIGDYVLTGGELPSMVIMDAVIRLLPGVLNEIGSALSDSFRTPCWIAPGTRGPKTSGDILSRRC